MNWIENHIIKLFKKLGIREGMKILDFGCGSGNYTIPIALIVGNRGVVYAIDKEDRGYWPGEGLNELRERISRYGLVNVTVIKTKGELRLPLSSNSIDFALLFDVLHTYYFPTSAQRIKLIREIHRVLKPGGCLLYYPGDPEVFHNVYEIDTIKAEIVSQHFTLLSVHEDLLIHENNLVKGHVYKYVKPLAKSRKIRVT
ncbi:MAG: hypothetical protein B6U69_01050 [Thermofilum sp. ex4484_15]|nr:MAG: hypothetical protein B6U69_01050 [Thermofilum sp. ex4484_15]